MRQTEMLWAAIAGALVLYLLWRGGGATAEPKPAPYWASPL